MRIVNFGIAALAVCQTEALPQKRSTPRPEIVYQPNYFKQKINHFPENGLPFANETFRQRYYFDDSYYQPGGPVYLYIGGETSGPSRFSNLQTGIIQILMQETHGLGVILENRYYGQSSPFTTSTTDQLAFLTTAQTIADNNNFAQNAVFPGVNGSLTAPGTPWIMYGGSLAGAQTAFTVKTYGDVIYGGIASSAVIHATVGYSDWYQPILKYGPQDCIGRITAITDKFDALIAANNSAAIVQLKTIFGLESLTDHRDFATAITNPIGNPGSYLVDTWQELNWNSTYGARDFFWFCGNITDIDAPREVTDADYALSNYTKGEPWVGLGGWGNYMKKYVLPVACPSGDYNSFDCWGTQHPEAWADVTKSRSYLWTSCAEQGLYIDAPKEGPSLISRVVDTSYEQQWCTWAFPPGEYNSVPPTPNVTVYNSYGDFNFSADRLAFIDGDQDPWNYVCYHSPLAPQRTQTSDLHPEHWISGAGHHWDSYGILDVEAEPQFIREAHYWEIRTVKKWLREFGNWKSSKRT
ncbi:extracelular serine carboxypeptidase-like protein [Xylariaceae sp. FL1019]|nr:extracelular serine carboxypeptidase-like protein [Xylariaceae sp. FL1019]